MVLPEHVDRYVTRRGIRVAGSRLTPSKVEALYCHPKIWIIRIQKMRWRQRIVCAFDERSNSAGMKTLQTVVSVADDTDSLKCLLGILASSAVNFWSLNYLADDMNQSYLERVPIPDTGTGADTTSKRRTHLVNLVDSMMGLQKQLAGAKSEAQKLVVQRQIDATDREIDQFVYRLYGLTKGEIAIVEGATK
jgi:hypothetical protein